MWEESDDPGVPANDLLFANLVLAQGLAPREKIEECLSILRKQAAAGLRPLPTLGALLLQKGCLGSPAPADATIRAAEVKPKTRRAQLSPGSDSGLPAEVAEAARNPRNAFGNFTLVRQVSQGGFGAVFLAWQRDLGRFVALKFLHSDDEEDVERFLREAQTAAKLRHPNIVPIYEVGEQDDRPFIAMEFIEGEMLHKLRLEPRRAVELLRDVAGAVQCAHDHGIIHRDLKPQNLMLARDGHVWVMDFGLARQLQGGTTLTVSGAIMGTPAYMPPEQAQGRRCDVRSDVYSLGATLYELLAGHPPHQAPTVLEVLKRVVESDPLSIRRINPKVDPELEVVIAKAMDKDPAKRYASARDLAEDLGRHLAGEPVLARPASLARKGLKWARRHRTFTAVAAVLVLVALAAGIVLAWNAARFRARIDGLWASAGDAERGGRHAEAEKLYAQVKTLVPSHPLAHEKALAMKTAAERTARAAAAERHVEAGLKHAARHGQLCVEIDALRGEEAQLAAAVPPWAAEAEKRPLWSHRGKLRRAVEEAARAREEALAAFASALAVEPGHAAARAELAQWHFRELADAERAGDAGGAREQERLVRLYDDGTLAPRLPAEGSIELDSNPTGAQAELWRYAAGPDGRLEAADARALGTCPFAVRKIPAGSYLVVLRKEGFRDVRYPVRVGRGMAHRGRVNLYTEDEIGKDFVYVPAGPFIRGDDLPENPFDGSAEMDDFFIARFEVTYDEYVQFLNDLVPASSAANAQKRVPRQAHDSGYFWRVPPDAKGTSLPADVDGRLAVMGVSWDDAGAYCKWRSWKDSPRVYRLPASAEWEKAARGVDGRRYPWGDVFDWSFTKGVLSRAPGLARQPEPVGSFPKDESPYGVRDMAGSMREWCEDWQDDKSDLRVARGGGWGMMQPGDFRVTPIVGRGSTLPATQIGIRVVKVPPRR